MEIACKTCRFYRPDPYKMVLPGNSTGECLQQVARVSERTLCDRYEQVEKPKFRVPAGSNKGE